MQVLDLHLADHLQHVLQPRGLGIGPSLRSAALVQRDLDSAVAVAKNQEHHPAFVADGVDPPLEGNGLARIGRAKRSAGVRTAANGFHGVSSRVGAGPSGPGL